MTAVGFWICISRSKTLPSLVSLMSARGRATPTVNGLVTQNHTARPNNSRLEVISLLTSGAAHQHLDGALGPCRQATHHGENQPAQSPAPGRTRSGIIHAFHPTHACE